ncbi:MAG TPA: cytochrome C, partial [Acetobacteraceae bacterium]|nr:cytochrome C [Acetobacteraceae bacterium]
FIYSPAMEKFKGKPWSFDALNEWLYKPSAYVPGTRMSFAGITNDKQRADVIAYLRTLSDSPVPLPAAKPAAAPAAPAPAAAGAPATAAPAPAAPAGNTNAVQPNAPAASPTPAGAPGTGPAAGGSASAPAAPNPPAKP